MPSKTLACELLEVHVMVHCSVLGVEVHVMVHCSVLGVEVTRTNKEERECEGQHGVSE